MSKNNISIEVIDNFEGTEIFDYKALEERVNFLSDSIRSSDLIPDEEIYHNPEEYLFDGVFEDNIDKEVTDENTETIGISYDSLMAEIMFFTEICQGSHLFITVDVSGRIPRVADHDRLCTPGDFSLKILDRR